MIDQCPGDQSREFQAGTNDRIGRLGKYSPLTRPEAEHTPLKSDNSEFHEANKATFVTRNGCAIETVPQALRTAQVEANHHWDVTRKWFRWKNSGIIHNCSRVPLCKLYLRRLNPSEKIQNTEAKRRSKGMMRH